MYHLPMKYTPLGMPPDILSVLVHGVVGFCQTLQHQIYVGGQILVPLTKLDLTLYLLRKILVKLLWLE
jgi:hypothetical protein